jgi:hypothetical protein
MGDSPIARAIVEGMAMAELVVAAQTEREQGRLFIAWRASPLDFLRYSLEEHSGSRLPSAR